MAVSVASEVAPRHLWRPAEDATDGPVVAGFAESLGLRLDPEQRLVLDVMFARRGPRWAAMEVAVIAPRQQGKTFAFEVACLADLFLFGGPDKLIIWTAHLFPTANEAFIDLKAIVDRHDFLSSRVSRITEAAGNQGIELVDGTRLKFLARSKSGGRGFSGSKVYLDESFALSPAEVGSLLPTLSAQPNPQVVYGSSAGRLDSAVLRTLRDRGRRGGDPSLAWVEWAAEPGDCATSDCSHLFGSDGCVLDDRDRWRQANTAMGVRTDVDFIASERRSLPPTEFMRERMGWWEDPPEVGADGLLAAWPDRASDAAPTGTIHLGLDVSADGRSAAIVGCGGGVLEVIDARRGAGAGWIPDRVAALRESHQIGAVGVLRNGPGKGLIGRIPDLVELNGVEESAASVGFVEDVNDGVLAHRGQQVLDRAAAGARRRLSGDGWRWSRRESEPVDISPLLAAVVARHLWASAAPAPLTTEQLLKSFG